MKPLMKLIAFAVVTGLATTVSAVTLNEYLEEVKASSLSYRGTQEQALGAELKAREADLVFTPKIFAEARTGFDAKPTTPPMRLYDELKSQYYSLGITQQFSFGLQTKLYYEMSKTDFVNPSATLNPTKYWDATPKVELTMPLWGGGFGRSLQASEEATRQQNYAEQFSSEGQAHGYLIQAESVYWALSAWKDVVRIQDQALQAAQNILSYVSKKKQMNLGEESDVIQARALVEARTLELQLAKNQADEYQRSFNRFLNRDANLVVTDLQEVDYKSLESIVVPTAMPGEKAEVRATEAQLASAKAAAQLVLERNRPTLDLYGSYAMTGRDAELNEALKNAGQDEQDAGFIGVRFSMPLNISATSDAKAGALKAERAAEFKRQYAVYSQEQDWANLTRSISDAKSNLNLLTKIEAAQKAKLENERVRLRQGRTTTYQVLLFEQDYSQSAVSKVKSAANILSLQSQIKLYQYSPQGVK